MFTFLATVKINSYFMAHDFSCGVTTIPQILNTTSSI